MHNLAQLTSLYFFACDYLVALRSHTTATQHHTRLMCAHKNSWTNGGMWYPMSHLSYEKPRPPVHASHNIMVSYFEGECRPRALDRRRTWASISFAPSIHAAAARRACLMHFKYRRMSKRSPCRLSWYHNKVLTQTKQLWWVQLINIKPRDIRKNTWPVS